MLILTPGNTADCVMAQECVSLIPGIKELLAYKGDDTDSFRAFLRKEGIKPVIPGNDKLAGNFFSALCLVAIVAYWL